MRIGVGVRSVGRIFRDTRTDATPMASKKRSSARAHCARAASIALVVACSGCAFFFPDEHRAGEGGLTGDRSVPEAFAVALQERYLQNASEAYLRGDVAAAKYYAARSVEAGEGRTPPPSGVDVEILEELDASDKDELRILSEWLSTALTSDMRQLRPEQAAKAQASYDCWARELMTDGDVGAKADCRARLETTLSALASPLAEAADLHAQDVRATAPEAVASIETGSVSNAPTDELADELALEAGPPPAAVEVAVEEAVEKTVQEEVREVVPEAAPEAEAPIATAAATQVEIAAPAAPIETTSIEASAVGTAVAPTRSGDFASASPITATASLDAIAMAARPIEGDVALFFERSSANITPEAELTLLDAIEQIRKEGRYVVTLIGHSDARHVDRAERALALRRAETVRAFLEERLGSQLDVGVEAFAVGKRTAGVSDNVSAALNRRVEIRIKS